MVKSAFLPAALAAAMMLVPLTGYAQDSAATAETEAMVPDAGNGAGPHAGRPGFARGPVIRLDFGAGHKVSVACGETAIEACAEAIRPLAEKVAATAEAAGKPGHGGKDGPGHKNKGGKGKDHKGNEHKARGHGEKHKDRKDHDGKDKVKADKPPRDKGAKEHGAKEDRKARDDRPRGDAAPADGVTMNEAPPAVNTPPVTPPAE